MKRIQRYTMSLPDWIESRKLDRLVYTRRGWFRLFCRFSVSEKRPFYWEFRDVLLTIVPRGRESLIIADRVLSGRRIKFHREEWIVPSRRVCKVLDSLYKRLPRSDTSHTTHHKSRNTQASRAILSFRGFLDELLHEGARLVETIKIGAETEREKSITFQDALVEYGIVSEDTARSDGPATRS